MRGAALILVAMAEAALAGKAIAQGAAPQAKRPVTSERQWSGRPSLLEARPHQVLGVPKAWQPIVEQHFEPWLNTYGGHEQEPVYTGLMQFGMRVDLERADWVPGLSMGAVGVWVQGANPSVTTVGDIGIVSNIAGVETVRLFKLWLRQRWWDGGLDIKAGLIPADEDFMVVQSALLFIHSSFGTLQSTALNIPVGIYPLASFGARAVLRPDEVWEARLGVYDGDAGQEADHLYISDLALTSPQGATLFAELTWREQLAGRDARVTWGGFAHLGLIPDYQEQTEASTGADRDRGLGNVYVMLEQDLAVLQGSTLTAFAHGSVAFPFRRAVVPWYADVGLVANGAAWGRADDHVGLGYAWTGFGDAYVRHARSRGDDVTRAESVLELTYRLAALPWVAVQPSMQWLFDPHFARRDAFLLALRVEIEA